MFNSVLEEHAISIIPEGYSLDLGLVLQSSNKHMTLNRANV
jgi:hypothetical protein